MISFDYGQLLTIATFIIGYFFITIEHSIKINKATIAILMAIICWSVQFVGNNQAVEFNRSCLSHHLADVSQVIIFLIGALTIVETVNQHRGFNFIFSLIRIDTNGKMIWAISVIAFFLSAILDNLTTTVVMISLIKKLISDRRDRLLIGSATVIAANAGGAWTPIGDVTTTMLWVGEQLTSLQIIKGLFLPSLACLLISTSLLQRKLGRSNGKQSSAALELPPEPMGTPLLFVGLASLLAVPLFSVLTGLPPYMGMLASLGVVWLFTDFIHGDDEHRSHLKVTHALTRIDLGGVLFFLGILLCIDALCSAGLLNNLAQWLDTHIGNTAMVTFIIGIASAIVDNVPLVAAAMGMYSKELYPTDHSLWQMLAYCAGTGGSMLVVGSAAGVVFMGMEKVDFIWYTRNATIPAACGYVIGFAIYLLMYGF